MKAILRKVVKARFLGPAVIMAVALVLISNLAYAYTTSNLWILKVQEDRFYNYDFLDEGADIVTEDFEWGSDGDSLATSGGEVIWKVVSPGNSKAEIDTAYKYAGSKSGKFYRDASNNVYAYFSWPAVGTTSIGYWFRQDGSTWSYFNHEDGRHRIIVGVQPNGTIQYWDTSWKPTAYKIPANTWRYISIKDINWDAATYDIYLGGELVKDNTPMNTGSWLPNKITFVAESTSGTFWIDDILVEGGSTGVSGAATMVFYNNAWVNKVKNMYYGEAIFAVWDYALLNDGSGWIWDQDRGTKTPLLAPVYSSEIGAYVYMHLRVYAPNPPDYMYNSAWGKYVLGTTHCDEFPEDPSGGTWHGYQEVAEEFFADWAIDDGYTVFEDWASFYNEEDFRVDVQPDGLICIWDNNGYATAVNVP